MSNNPSPPSRGSPGVPSRPPPLSQPSLPGSPGSRPPASTPPSTPPPRHHMSVSGPVAAPRPVQNAQPNTLPLPSSPPFPGRSVSFGTSSTGGTAGTGGSGPGRPPQPPPRGGAPSMQRSLTDGSNPDLSSPIRGSGDAPFEQPYSDPQDTVALPPSRPTSPLPSSPPVRSVIPPSVSATMPVRFRTLSFSAGSDPSDPSGPRRPGLTSFTPYSNHPSSNAPNAPQDVSSSMRPPNPNPMPMSTARPTLSSVLERNNNSNFPDPAPPPPPPPSIVADIGPVSEETASLELSFYTPDNESNLVNDAEGQVKAASFSKLVERLTGANAIGTDRCPA